ncbi:unnamed protein product [Cylicocyclus nassatus]|uniref:GPR180/TMEM145 transmembrane domain-containing protein n=1 Tax=Cylicocyclus nassatus TaxID=53992 RepID=A0AA36H1E8_CYLNA|nr:unnamed protein product [Cylicocyclus nassatus]
MSELESEKEPIPLDRPYPRVLVPFLPGLFAIRHSCKMPQETSPINIDEKTTYNNSVASVSFRYQTLPSITIPIQRTIALKKMMTGLLPLSVSRLASLSRCGFAAAASTPAAQKNLNPEELRLTFASPDMAFYNNAVLKQVDVSTLAGMVAVLGDHVPTIDVRDHLFQCGLLTVNYIIGCQLSFRRLYHNAYRISTQSLLLDVCGLSMMVIAYGSYALDGVGFPFLKLMAELFRGFAQMFFIFMVLLLARGQNVTKMKLAKMDNISLFCLTSFFITSYIGMLFWEIWEF